MMKAKNRQHLVMAVMTAVMMGSTPLTVQAAAPDLRGAQNSVSALQRQAQQEAQGRNSLPSSQPAKAEVQNTLPTQGPGSDQVHFTIRNFRLEAPEFYLDKKDLATILKKSMGHELTLRDLNATVDELTRYARQHGYPAAAAYVPAQESKDGMVLIRMMPGRYGEVKLENHSKLKDSVAQGFLHGLKKGAIVKTTSGRGVVEEVNLITGKLRVKLDNNDTVATFDKKEVEVIKDSVIRIDKNEMKALKSLEGK